jgi:hypothetical protein
MYSKQKGARAEVHVKDLLCKYTKYNWERTPLSGALDPKHGLKGDLYVPNARIRYCVEVKHYKEDHLTSKILSGTNPMFLTWWAQTRRESAQINKEPMLIFKFDRSKWFVGLEDDISTSCRSLTFSSEDEFIKIFLLEDLLKENVILWE